MRGVPATWGVRLCGPGAGKLGYRLGHTGTSSVVVRGVSVKFDSREPKEQGGKPGVDAERGLAVWRAGGWRGQRGAPLSGPGTCSNEKTGWGRGPGLQGERQG